MRKLFVIGIMILLIAQQAQAQRKIKQMDPEKEEQEQKEAEYEGGGAKWYDKLSFGGNFGATFGSGFSFLTIQPQVFYRITETTMLGGGFTYYYWQRKYQLLGGGSLEYSDNAYGINAFARQTLFNPVFVHAEYMPMNFKNYDIQTGEYSRKWVNAFYLGGGVQQKFSDRGGYYFMVLYDVLHKDGKSFFSSPFDVRVGVFF